MFIVRSWRTQLTLRCCAKGGVQSCIVTINVLWAVMFYRHNTSCMLTPKGFVSECFQDTVNQS